MSVEIRSNVDGGVIVALLGAVAMGTLAAGCAGTAKTETGGGGTEKVAAQSSAGLFSGVQIGDQQQVAQKRSTSANTDAGSSDEPQRKLVRTASLTVRVDEERPANEAVQDLAKSYDGYLVSSRPGQVVIRVQADRLEEAMEAIVDLKEIDKLLERRIEATDVTERMRDYNIRLENKLEARKRYFQLMSKAQNVEEMLKIEKELERLNGEIERLKGKLKALKTRVATSRITVYLRDGEQRSDVSGPSNLTPGLRYTTLGILGSGDVGQLHGGTFELSLFSSRDMTDPDTPSHFRLFFDFALLHQFDSGSAPSILWGGGFRTTFESTPGRKWLIPGVGLEAGQLVTPETEVGHISPTASLILWSNKDAVATVDASYFLPPAELETLSGWRLDAGVGFSFW